MEIRDAGDLVQAYEWAQRRHKEWKGRSSVTDLVAADKWSQVWSDLSDEPDPLVENTLLEALEDKAYSAASVVPRLQVAPSSGTKADRGELQASKKRKGYVSYQQRSGVDRVRSLWNLDWFQHGARYGHPWVDWDADPRFPYAIRHDPRHAYPLSHDSKGELTSILFAKQRRIQDIEQEWGKNHPAVAAMKSYRREKNRKEGETVEEVWFFDMSNWAVALIDGVTSADQNKWRYQNPTARLSSKGKQAFWLTEREAHLMSRCPVVEDKRPSFDGEYRGALDSMVPGLGTAQRLMSAVLEDIAQQIGAPVLLDNITNPEDYGPEAVLEGTGDGRARMEALRQPSNFEARSAIQDTIEGTRRVGKHPQQRTGEVGASINSAAGTKSVMGNFNSELAEAQRGQLSLERDLWSRVAEFDVKWCDTRKRIKGFDEGQAFEETYLPSSLFRNDDYRVDLSFGGGLGLDQQNFMVQLATAKNLDGLSMRTFMTKTGLVDDVLAEETEMMLEQISKGFTALTLQQAMEEGNMQPLIELVEQIDGDKITARAAIMEAVKKAQTVAANIPGTPGPDPVRDGQGQVESLAQGGIPGQAAGLPGPPDVSESLNRMLPPGAPRRLAAP